MYVKELEGRYRALVAVEDKILPRRFCVAIRKNMAAVKKEIDFFCEQRRDIATRYAVKEGNAFILENNCLTFDSEENKEGFIEEMRQLDETEIDVPVTTVEGTELDRCDLDRRYDMLSPKEEAALSWMIEY